MNAEARAIQIMLAEEANAGDNAKYGVCDGCLYPERGASGLCTECEEEG